jgi:hypothetical protein
MDHRSIGADLLKLPEQAILPFPMKMEEEGAHAARTASRF